MTKPYMERLDPDQTEAVTFAPEPLLVMAGAGSGKTALLTARIAHMIDSGLVKPEEMFVSAFTRAAANEMKERVELLTDCSGLEIGTFHSIMFRLLNRERAAAGLDNWGLCKSGRQKMWFQKMLESPSRDYPDALGLACDIGNVMSRVGQWKNACIHHYDAEVKETLDEAPYGTDMFAAATLYPRYERWLAAEGMIDFDDMLLKSYDLLATDKNVLERAHQEWSAFFVDECQDTNLVQFKLIELLAPPGSNPNITIVGDTRQALYEFRGARPELLDWFEDRWKAHRLDLANNYRSVSTVVDSANKLVNGIMAVVDQKSIRGEGAQPETFMFADEFEQAIAIADDVTLKREAGKKGGDVAVLVRTNAQSAAIESAFVKAQLPYWCNGGGFFEHMEIGDLVAYLRLTQDRSNSAALHRIINRPTRFLGKAFVEAVEANAHKYDGDLVKSMRFTDSYNNRKLSKKQRAAAFELVDLLESLTERDGDEIYPGQALLKVLNSTKYIDWLKQNTGMGDDDGDSRKENIEALQRVCGEHSSIRSLLHFIDESSRLQQDSGDATHILTVHRSKGGEWETVWVANMHDDSFPHKAAQIENNLMPERRIAYVAFTRAMDELKLAVPMVNEKGSPVSPSRFIAQAGIQLADLPSSLEPL